MKKEQEKLLVTFSEESHFLHFYSNLPKKAKQRLRPYHRWHSLALLREDYELLKDRILPQGEEVENKVHVENNIQYKLHNNLPTNNQITPWGVSALKVPEVWSRSQGQHVKVGIIDTGIYAKHPDLRGRVYGGVNTVDKASPLIDPNGHGTHVAGTIAALNNSYGVVGIAPMTELYSLRAFSVDGTASLTDLAEAIDWAIHHNIKILNMSFGSGKSSIALHRAITAALRHGVIMVASAGNTGGAVEYPAKHPEVFAVGALAPNKKIAAFSSQGKEINYVAPGVDILSTWPVSPYYNTLSGTSMAAPHITAICALIASKQPDITPQQLKSILDISTVKLPKISSLKQGNGVVMAPRAFEELRLQTE